MSKKSIYALLIAICIPLFCYLWLKSASDTAIVMPKKYFLDSVVNRTINGKMQTDSFWHKTANIHLVNQLGDTVSLYDIKGKIIVLDLFFTHCNSICPRITRSMKLLQQSFKKGGDSRNKIDTSIVQFLSISVDPERDSAEVLKAFADRFGVDSDNWWMLTGNRDSIYNFIFQELKIDKLSKEPVTPEFAHTSRFVLLDRNYVVRGRMEEPYSGLDSASLNTMAKDIGLLMLEKDKTQKSEVFQAIKELKWLWVIVIAIVAIFVVIMIQNKKLNG